MTYEYVFKNLMSLLGLAGLILSGLAGQIFAGTVTKTFDFGAGGDNPTFRGHSRSFATPEKVAIVIAVNYRVNGETPLALVVETGDAASRILVSRDITAEKNYKRLIINISAADNETNFFTGKFCGVF